MRSLRRQTSLNQFGRLDSLNSRRKSRWFFLPQIIKEKVSSCYMCTSSIPKAAFSRQLIFAKKPRDAWSHSDAAALLCKRQNSVATKARVWAVVMKVKVSSPRGVVSFRQNSDIPNLRGSNTRPFLRDLEPMVALQLYRRQLFLSTGSAIKKSPETSLPTFFQWIKIGRSIVPLSSSTSKLFAFSDGLSYFITSKMSVLSSSCCNIFLLCII